MGWREDIGIIRTAITGESSVGWLADVMAIVRSFGYEPRSWREALAMLAERRGASGRSWRENLWNIAESLGKTVREGWRGDLRYIREYYETPMPERYYESYSVLGNSVQIGVPTPDNPIEIRSTGDTEGKLLLWNGREVTEIALSEPLRSLPNGVSDDLEYRQRGRIILDGSEVWQTDTTIRSLSNYAYIKPPTNMVLNNKIISNRFLFTHTGYSINGANNISYSTVLIINIRNELTGVVAGADTRAMVAEKIKAWVAAHNVEVEYDLKTPIAQSLTLPRIRDYGEPLTSLNEIQPGRITYERDGETFETPLINMSRAMSIEMLSSLPDKSGEETQMLRLGESNLSNLTDEEIAVGQLKNYTLV